MMRNSDPQEDLYKNVLEYLDEAQEKLTWIRQTLEVEQVPANWPDGYPTAEDIRFTYAVIGMLQRLIHCPGTKIELDNHRAWEQ